MGEIVVRGARSNNLKNVTLKIPKEKLVIMTGISGSGKTSMAFETIFSEAQRRYVESLSAYARQFLGGMNKPDVDSIDGLCPGISIDQKTTSKNPRSTVGTVTEIYDYLRLLFARIGKPICPDHHILIEAQTIEEMCKRILSLEEGSKFSVLSRVVNGEKGRHEKTIELLKKEGFNRVKIDGGMYEIDELPEMDKNIKHTIDIVIDRLKVKEDIKSRLYASLEVALKFGDGKAIIEQDGKETLFSSLHSCPICGFSIPKLEPRLFSFNSPFGACDECKGLGVIQSIDYDLLIPDYNLSINQGGIRYYKNMVGSDNLEWQKFCVLCKHYNIDLDKPLKDFSDEEMDIIMNGSKEMISYDIESSSLNRFHHTAFIEGVARLIERRYRETTSRFSREYYLSYISDHECPSCHGKRLSRQALSVFINDKNIDDICKMSIDDAIKYFKSLELNDTEKMIASLVLKEILNRLNFLTEVGLGYLRLDRSSATLSGGEAQRIRLATQIGSKLSGVLYVLDEPSIGLHPRDNMKLIQALKEMRDLGNSLIVVEHDETIMRESDYIIDFGPGAGVNGGEVVAAGTPKEIMENPNSITGKYLSGKLKVQTPSMRRQGNGKFVKIIGARENNLKGIDVTFPLGKMIVVTGVSGSGKSTLVNEILVKAIQKKIYHSKVTPGRCDEIEGLDNIDKVVMIDQSPIGRTPRSNPATYTGVFDYIRELFAQTTEAKIRGYDKGRFSFNNKGGRCEKCGGDGVVCIEMHFLPNVYIPCEECNGTRYNNETLEVKYKGKSIADVLDMTVSEARDFFSSFTKIKNIMDTLCNVGLGYIKLNQMATTLSGGEAQRVKLSSELYKTITDKAVYVLDEPTTGLHTDDISRLMSVLNKIVDSGATVIIIEHNLDVIKQADYVIDLGPEGGDLGGNVVYQGSVEGLVECESSYTAKFIKEVL